MDAWDTLLINSTAPNGSDAWEHLLAQEGGGGGGTIYVHRGALDVDYDIALLALDIEVKEVALDCEVSNYSVDWDIDTLNVVLSENTVDTDFEITNPTICQ